MKNSKVKMVKVDEYDPKDHPGESYVGKHSITQPNEALTVQELFDRYTQGLPLNNDGRGSYDFDEEQFDEHPDFDRPDTGEVARMDMVDQETVVAEVVQRGKHAKARLDEAEAADKRKKKEKQDRIDKLLDKDPGESPGATSKLPDSGK